jgi:hypothetical protein
MAEPKEERSPMTTPLTVLELVMEKVGSEEEEEEEIMAVAAGKVGDEVVKGSGAMAEEGRRDVDSVVGEGIRNDLAISSSCRRC